MTLLRSRSPRFSPARLREARGDRSVEVLAAVAGVSAMTIRNWEAGRGEPDATPLKSIADFVTRPMEWFFEPGEDLDRVFDNWLEGGNEDGAGM